MGKELAAETRSKIPQSQIPVITPRPSRSSLPSSLSTPHLGLVPPTRYPAVSGTPGPNTGSNTSTAGVAGGLVSLRSFRNLLSFGPAKHNAAHTNTNVARPFGGLRRSSHAERNTTYPPTPEKSQEDIPVLSIEMTHTIELSDRVHEPLIDSEELQARLGLRARTPETISPVSSSANSVNTIDAPTTPSPVGVSELSTILEADTSGISQALRLDESQEESDLSLTNYGPTLKAVASGPLLRPLPAGPYKDRGGLDSDASQLDLSTTMLSSEVQAAMSGSDLSRGWLDTVVVEDTAHLSDMQHKVTPSDVSFNLKAVDPDLAALLSPHHLSHPQKAVAATSLSNRNQDKSSPSSPVIPTTLPDPPVHPTSLPASPSQVSQAHSTPARRSSLARPNIPRIGTSFVPKLARSVSERPTGTRTGNSLLPSPTIPTTPVQGSRGSSSGRASLQLRRVSPASDTLIKRRPTSGDGDGEPRKSAASRLVAPSRHFTANTIGRGIARNLEHSPSSPLWDPEDSPSARAGSTIESLSSISKRNALQRPSLDDGISVRASSRLGGRERSSSLEESTPYHPSRVRQPDWLGPRTAKAFAAAGLLDTEKDVAGISASRPGSRFSTTRSERDMRSQYAPSRLAFSEAGSRASWRRRSGSISRTAGSSDILSVHGGPLSESVSTPRSAFSAASTAPTSISAPSSTHKQLQSELQLLQDRHALETGALLNALADSQRTTRLLRDENVQLRDQIQHLEDRLADALDELRRLQLAPPPKLPRSTFHRLPNADTEPSRRPLPRSRLQTVVHPEPTHEQDDNVDLDLSAPYDLTLTYDPMPMPTESLNPMIDPYSDTHKRRHSASSSIFPVLPSNMSMLLHDEGGPEQGTARSSRSVSSSPAKPRIPLPGGPEQDIYDLHHRATSIGNISPTTANFSMMTGSPGSLCLRPEHEHLLGDMPTLDLCAESYDHDSYDDRGR